MQVYSEVLPLLPDVQYNAPARILTLRASGSRKQPRLPGALWVPLAFAVHAAKPKLKISAHDLTSSSMGVCT